MSSDDEEVPPQLLYKKKQIDLAAAKRKWHIETHSSKPEPKEEQEEQEEQEYDDQPCVRFGQGRGKGSDILEIYKRSAATNSFKPIQDNEDEGEDDASGLIDSFADKLDEPVAPHSFVRRSSVDSTSTISSLANELNEATSFMMAVSHPVDIKMAIGIRDALNELDFSTEDGRTEAIHLTKKLRQKLRPRPTPACRECMNPMRECICKRS